MLPSLIIATLIGLGPAAEGILARDRQIQNAALECFGADDAAAIPALVQRIRSSDRFDVRSYAMRALARCGPAGVDALTDLGPELTRLRRDGDVEQFIDVFAATAANPLEELIALTADGHASGFVLARLADQTGTDRSALARRLLDSGHPILRREAAMHLYIYLPAIERARRLPGILGDTDATIRAAMAYPEGLGLWDDQLRRDHPDDLAVYLESMRGLLSHADPVVVRGAAYELGRLADPDATTAQFLLDAADRADLSIHQRSAVLRAYAVIEPDHESAVEQLASRLDHMPIEVCRSLDAVPVECIPDALLGRIAAMLTVVQLRESNPAQQFLTPSEPLRRESIVPRVAPVLIDLVATGELRAASQAAAVLGMSATRQAIPALIDRLERDRDDPGSAPIAVALLRIDSDDPEVRRTIVELVDNRPTNAIGRYSAVEAVHYLKQHHADEPWVQSLIEPVFKDPRHPLHAVAGHYPPKAFADMIEQDLPRLLSELRGTAARDACLAFVMGDSPARPDPKVYTAERDRRIAAATALRNLVNPPQDVIDALADAIVSPLPAVRHLLDDESVPASRRNALEVLWLGEEAVITSAASAIAPHLEAEPEAQIGVFHRMRSDHEVLRVIFSTMIELGSGRVRRAVAVHPEIAADLVTPLAEAADRPTPFSDRQAGIISALAGLPIDSQRTHRILTGLIQFGSDDAPAAALRGLGHGRPVQPDTIDIVRIHLRDIRPAMRSAAVGASLHLGPFAEPLVDDLVSLARQYLGYSTSSEVVRALDAIAPGDPRVEELKSEVAAASRTSER